MADQFNEFEQQGPFYDNTNFPRGFNKSGEFTLNESDLLTRYGKHLRLLETQDVGKQSTAQKRFIKVCRGEVEAESTLEKAWMKYRTKVAQPKIIISPYSSASTYNQDDQEETVDTDFDDD